MLTKLLIAWLLMAACVTIHSIGLVAAGRWLLKHVRHPERSYWHTIWLLVPVAGMSR